jgi:hypothetical protein
VLVVMALAMATMMPASAGIIDLVPAPTFDLGFYRIVHLAGSG